MTQTVGLWIGVLLTLGMVALLIVIWGAALRASDQEDRTP